MGKASALRNMSIQAPGRGRARMRAGLNATTVKGAANPRPRARNTASAAGQVWVRAKPRAGPMNGAVQGAATTTARTPVKIEPMSPSLAASPDPSPCREVPISKRPERLRAAPSMISVRAATITGD